MTLEALANIGELLGGLAVLSSLIYLIFEVRRNTRSVRSRAVWDSEESFGDLNLEISQSPQLAGLCLRALRQETRSTDLSEDEWAQIFFMARACLQRCQAQWFLWKQGDLPDDLWRIRRQWAKAYISIPTVAEVWELERQQNAFMPEFRASIESAELSGDLTIDPQRDAPQSAR